MNNNDLFLRAIIIDHYKNPLNKKIIKNNHNYITRYLKSPTCIDEIYVHLKIEKNKIIDSKFHGYACSICICATDIICEYIKNQSIDQAKEIIKNYYMMLYKKGEYNFRNDWRINMFKKYF